MKKTPRLLLALLLATTATLLACPPQGDAAPEGVAFDRTALLTGVVDNWLTPKLAAFSTATTTLQTATSAHADAPADAAKHEAAKEAWRAAMAAWQAIEPLQLGPLAAPDTRVGGKGLRDGVYSWPIASPCGVDQAVVKNEFNDAGWAAKQLVNVVGLAAIEAALFAPDDDNACSRATSINTDGSWDALGEASVRARRAGLAKVLATDLVSKAAAIQSAMSSYGTELKTAGNGSALFATAQAGVDDVYAALFYVELKVKDLKLGTPAGLTLNCPASSCEELLESPVLSYGPLSSTSKEHVLVNLQTVREIFVGAGGAPGFDDFLAAADASELSTDIVAEIDAAIAAVQAYDGSFEATVKADPAGVAALYELVKAFADDFKADLASTLSVRVPAEGAGDND